MKNLNKYLDGNHLLKELDFQELTKINGGTKAELVGLGIAQVLTFGMAGTYGYAYATYNFFK